MDRIARRSFLQRTGVAAVGAAALGVPQVVSARVLGSGEAAPSAKERLNIAHIGVGGMGGGHLGYMLARQSRGDVNVVAVCDVDEGRLAAAVKSTGGKATPYRDYRYILERKDVDAVVIATPDHWHACQTVHACESGKHVYVEKPACGTIEEGKAMVRAAKANRCCVQVGSQGRSQREAFLAHQYIANGMIGRVHTVTCWHYATPSDDNPVADSEPPAELDWDLWLGPLPWRPFNRRYLHGVFRWLLESGGGQIRDRGAHVMSNALHFMNADHTGPVSIETRGRVPTRGLWDSAIEMEVTYQFKNPDWTLIWAQPGKMVPYFDRDRVKREGIRESYGAVYQGEKDQLVVWVGDGQVYTEKKAVDYQLPAGGVEVPKSPRFDHHEDWFEGIKTGRKTIMNVEAGVATAFLCVLGNLSLIVGRKLAWDPVKQEIVGDEAARRLMSRPQRYPYVL
ncbi:MAG TPA: Gfo/Idh/MocA family oxidoreductase [Verrucomicrobiota bacterium]|nr:Gfo/Idh/MocA family oxidoreductase [Verrucomicrobiota bacterium]HNU52683.1 Gfo/Idh/MocA family oxidoreductase [Verrucomicrobiota bacterium]